MRGLDYSAGKISGAAIKAAGYGFVIRYIDDPARGLTSKHITPAEFQDLTANGVAVYLVFEVDTSDAFGGYNQGIINAQRARRGADWIGYPPGGVIFFCADTHLTAAQIPNALGYLDGAAAVIGHGAVGCYGFWEYVDAAIAANKAAYYWQCGIAPDATDPVHVWQRNVAPSAVTVGGVQCDINDLLRPITTTVGDDLTPEQDAILRDLHEQFCGKGDRAPGQVTGWDQLGGKSVVDALADVHWNLFQPGALPSRIPGDSNTTNLRDAIMDTIARVSVSKAEVEALNAKVDALAAPAAPAPLTDTELDTLAAKVAAHLSAIQFKAV